MAVFRDSRAFGPTVDAAAERLGISATAVEKDYWVSQVLHVLRRDFGDAFIFKGGTSLSKGYGIIERFSEDIDLLILSDGKSRGAVDKLMKAMAQAAAIGTGGESSAIGDAETGRHRAYEVSYPATHPPTAVLNTSVLLEMGVRGGTHPHELVPISSLLGQTLEQGGTDLAEFEDLLPFEVAVLHPGRTLLEKLVLVHGLAESDEDRVDARTGRHFYDIFQLLGDPRVLLLLKDRATVEQVLGEIREVSHRHFGGQGEVRPVDGFATSITFDPASEASRRLRQSYETTMPELHFGAEELPAWEAICARVAQHSGLL